MHRWIYPAILSLATPVLAARAHHSIAGVYDSSQRIEVAGVVTEFRFVRPHAFLIIDANPGTAEPELWQLEMDNHFELIRVGMTTDTFRPGDRVVVVGSPGRVEARRIYIRRLDRLDDGFRYEQVGRSPRIIANVGRSDSIDGERR